MASTGTRSKRPWPSVRGGRVGWCCCRAGAGPVLDPGLGSVLVSGAGGGWLAWWWGVCWHWGRRPAIARAEKGIADANASATASREAALTPELRAKRDAALAEPAPAKPSQMNEESAEGAAASVSYFLDLYRYAYMTGNTTEFAAMSDDSCKFCQSAIDNATNLHKAGGVE